MAWACQRFWKRRAAPLPLSRSLGRLRRWGWWTAGQCRGAGGGCGCFGHPRHVPHEHHSSSPLPSSDAPPRSQSGLLSAAEERLPSSRYETDFTELRALGRGGYGVVVAGGWGARLRLGMCRPAAEQDAVLNPRL